MPSVHPPRDVRVSVGSIALLTSALVASLHALPAIAQPPLVESQVPSTTIDDADVDPSETGVRELRFSFQATPWREVISWLAEETNAALYFGDLPPGSFTYSDPNPFTPDEAIDRVNLFLLPQGYTLVRSGELISVISLGDPRSMQQLSSLAKLVTTDQLETLNDHDVVKCIFKLGELKADDAVEELSALSLMTTPVTFSKTNQVMITDTVRKLKNVKAILDAFEPQMMSNGTVVKSFALQHVQSEDVLVVARPHLGLAIGEMIGIDVSLSSDVQGKHIFVTGVEDKVKLIEGLVAAIDRPEPSLSPTDAQPELRSHAVQGGNTEVVYNVLQTLLAGKSVRLSMDEDAGTVVALATPDVQTEISQTIEQLQATDADFAVIPLKWVDPYFVISLLEEMLELTPTYDKYGNEIPTDAPKIDADPGNMRLFVRGKQHQIEDIKKIVAGLDIASNVDEDTKIRILPVKGKQAMKILETAATFWQAPNPIILYQDSDASDGDRTERVVNESSADSTSTAVGASDTRTSTVGSSSVTLTAAASIAPAAGGGRWLTDNHKNSAAPIRCQLTARGLLAQSDDVSALDRFERHLRTVSGPFDSIPSAPIVFYLKYTKSADALRMLAELLDGGVSAEEAVAGSLVNGSVSSASDLYLGSIVMSKDGTTTMMADTMTVVADSRLNRLIAQGTTTDIERIEEYLSVIDKDSSITDIETHGSSEVIELENSRASEVADAIRQAFPDRVVAAKTSAAGIGGAGGQVDPRALAAARPDSSSDKDKSDKKSASKSAGSAPERDLEPKMTVAVHEPSNSLILTAPEQLLEEAKALAMKIDARDEQSVEVIVPVHAAAVDAMLRQVFLGDGSGSDYRSSSQRTASSRSDSSRSKSGR